MAAALSLCRVDPSPEKLEKALIACAGAARPSPACLDTAIHLEELYSHDEDPLKMTRAQSYRAQFLQTNGKEEEALRLYENIVATREAAFGDSDSRVAESLNWLGNARLKGASDPGGAGDAFRRALEIFRRSSGSESVEVAKISLNLAVAESAGGHYHRSLDLMRKSLSTMELAMGPEHPYVEMILDQLAAQETELGLYTDAMRHSRRALELAEKIHGPGSLRWAHTLHNRSWLLIRMGEFGPALDGMEQSWKIFRREYGDRDLRTVTVGENLAETLMGLGDLDRAAEIIDLSIQGARAEGNPGLLALSLGIRGNLDLRRRALDAAQEDFDEARALLSKPEEGHPRLIVALEGQARVALLKNKPERALSALKESLTISRRAFGSRHPKTAEQLVLQAEAFRRLGQVDRAVAAALEAEKIGWQHLEIALPVVDERLALRLAETRTEGVSTALRMARSLSEEQLLDVWEAVMHSRAAVFDEMARRARNRRRAGLKPKIEKLGRTFDEARRSLAERVVRSVTVGSLKEDADALEGEFDRVENLERQLARLEDGGHPPSTVGIREILDTVGPASALVAYVRIDETSLGPMADEAESAYLALVLGPAGRVTATELGSASRIEEALQLWREAFESRGLDRTVDEERLRGRGEKLRALIWDPLSSHIGSAKGVTIIADGALHLINFDALPSAEDRYLIEDGPAIRRVNAERDLSLKAGQEAPVAGGVLFACGDPDFSLAPEPETRLRTDAGDLLFGKLPGARVEVAHLEALWRKHRGDTQIRVLIGREATEARFVQLIEGAGTIHIATHAFFLDSDARRRDRLRESPLFRSGLALAGAGGAVDGGDGLLTAAEISSLDLGCAQWVVLSACGTGLGDIRQGEGVLGLERAFRIAGARSLIVSLWPVGDEETQRWMERFYSYGLDGSTATEALHRASIDILRKRRREGRSTHPASWGAFVALGS